MRKLNVLGYIIDSHDIWTNPEKTAAIERFPQPLSVTDVKSFLGLAGYYRKFIKGYAKIAEPLSTLTKKEAKVALEWRNEHTEAFQQHWLTHRCLGGSIPRNQSSSNVTRALTA